MRPKTAKPRIAPAYDVGFHGLLFGLMFPFHPASIGVDPLKTEAFSAVTFSEATVATKRAAAIIYVNVDFIFFK